MSGINGDKSRFHRERKQKIARRLRNHKIFAGQVAPRAAAAAPASKSAREEAKVSE
jgi:hypothetical protein